jgi:superfamily II DNA or RNA helicase
MNLDAIRRASDPKALLSACVAARLEALEMASADIAELPEGVPGRVLDLWVEEAESHANIRLLLEDTAVWERLRRAAGSAHYTRILFQLRGWLAERGSQQLLESRRKPTPVTLAPPPKVVVPPPNVPVYPGMPMDALRAWALAARIERELDRPCSQLVSPYAIPMGTWFGPYAHAMSVAAILTARPSTDPKEMKKGAVPRTYAETLAAELMDRAATVAKLQAEQDARWAARRRPTEPVLAAAWDKLAAARVGLDAKRPPPVGGAARVAFSEDPPQFRLTAGPAEGCDAWSNTEVTVRLDGEKVQLRCNCPRGLAECARGLAALDAGMMWMSGLLQGVDAEVVRRALATPAWARTLADLDRLAPAEVAPPPEPVFLGWAVSFNDAQLALWPLRCTEKKRGDGWKVARATMEEVRNAGGGTAALDRAVFDAMPEVYQPSRLARLVERLVGHPRVFWEGKSTQPAQVRAAPLGFRLSPIEEGGARLLTVAGGEPEPASTFVEAPVFRTEAALLRWDSAAGTLTVIRAARSAQDVLFALARRGGDFPADALPELVRRLPAISRLAPVTAGHLVESIPAEPRLQVRLELLGELVLRVEARIRPRPDLAPQIPGELPEQIFLPTPSGVAAVRRDLHGEPLFVQQQLATVPLGHHSIDEPYTWQIDQPEQAIDALAALQALPDLEVVWSGPPKRVATARSGGLRIQVGTAKQWFAVGGELAVEGGTLPVSRLLQAIAARRNFVKVNENTWVRIEQRLREQLEPLADATVDGALSPVNAPLLLALEDEGARVDAPPRWTQLLDRVREAPSYRPDPPTALKAELRPYQQDGFAWLARLATWAEGAVLADDMGLGKTVQTLALLLHRAALGPALVVAPTSVGFNWVRQAERFAPSLRVRLARGADRPRADEPPGPGDVLVTSYDLLIRDVDILSTFEFATFVLDEAQAVKNPDTHRARAARSIQAQFRVGLSGTPLENRTSELWSLFAAVAPGVLGARDRFRTTYALPIERDGDADRRRGLARRIRPFILRRVKSEVARDLPERTEVRVDVDLSADERRLYDAARALALDELTESAVPEQQRRIQVLAALTRLRQLACHPRLVDPEAVEESSKLGVLVDLLSQLREEGRRTLVFSQFVRQLQLVRERLATEGFKLRYLDGSTPEQDRRAEVERFQAGEGEVFLVSLKAGGTGLDLTAASDVVILDPWWNPSVEDQAADRAHRIGQTRAVTIYRLVARETVEEKILALHEQKRDLVSSVLEGTGAASTLSADELLELLREGTETGAATAALEDKAANAAGRVPEDKAVSAGAKVLAFPTQRLPREVAVTDEAVPARAPKPLPDGAPAAPAPPATSARASAKGARAPAPAPTPPAPPALSLSAWAERYCAAVTERVEAGQISASSAGTYLAGLRAIVAALTPLAPGPITAARLDELLSAFAERPGATTRDVQHTRLIRKTLCGGEGAPG